MAFMSWFGYTFIAFGPSLAIFTMTIADDATQIIIMFTSAFFWLVSLLFSSIIWQIPFSDLKLRLGISVALCVAIQELFRYLFYLLMKKADKGLLSITTSSTISQTRQRKHKIAYVAGFGFGVMSGAFSVVNLLATASGPGTVGIKGNSDLFFLSSAIFTSIFILLNIFWSVIIFDGFDKRNWKKIAYVFATHELTSLLTLVNVGHQPNYSASITTSCLVLLITTIVALYTAGGNIKSLITSLVKRQVVTQVR
ncbi:Gamma-secretase subunit APH-1A [Trichoplax sp. H2]|uniref:Gamma-secretase subunit Aph-1 n=1 Tax=Trichoplax adhaerens TaxID=10228 RepID=B3RLD0_TRIAD|nr:hypothetical protein TRIADDRAFT_19466 [Trichoplax adhaerens]EDV28746.1 hypothetical protein TRIADDRAFT_19466 [Trichoplax adhaerens]RDD41830.1 Gamma-secretase subunit APH-1A [Trichoplax sp. H2]|eukprot:XP_002107948.1 hypothetical protein TRIADDRAFT_19466 [Trichoplax adhaerens]